MFSNSVRVGNHGPPVNTIFCRVGSNAPISDDIYLMTGPVKIFMEVDRAVRLTSAQIPGIYPDNVTTTSVSVSPVTSRADQDGVTTIIGYTFTNSISVKISNVSNDLLSQVLDTAVSRGGNNLTISRVDFSLSDRLSYNITVAARRQAAADARASAQTYTDVRILHPSELDRRLLFNSRCRHIVTSTSQTHMSQGQLLLHVRF